MSHALMLGTTTSGEVEKVLVNSSGKLEVDATITGGGDATAANQTTMIGHLSTIKGDTTSLDAKVVACDTTGKATLSEQQAQTAHLAAMASDTSSLDTKIVACDTTGKATLSEQQSQTTHLSTLAGAVSGTEVQVDVLSSTLPSGAATLTEQQSQTANLATISSDTTSLDTKIVACDTTGKATLAEQQSQTTQLTSVATSVGKIRQGYDATIASGGSGLQQNLMYGRDSNTGDLDAIKVNANGNLLVNVDERTKETSTGQLWTAQSIAAGASLATASIDMQNHRHVAIYGDTTSTLSDTIKIEFSDDNTNWYTSDQSFIYPDMTTSQFAHTITEVIVVRYIRFSTTNSDTTAHTYNLKYSIMNN